MSWRHLNVFQHRCENTCRLPRGKCRQCGRVLSAAAEMWMKTAGLKILSFSPISARLNPGFVPKADNSGASHDPLFPGREDFESSLAALAIDLFNVLKVGQSREHRD
jgi:hypothetical protein